tara:strand:- start:391 stop:552 length:162 start_codon:yes stop_codon:yes gene_type:complete
MNKSYLNQKNCAISLKNYLIDKRSTKLKANCMDLAKQKIKNKVISIVNQRLKK